MNDNLPVKGQKSFEELKKTNKHNAEYWNAKDLQPLLGYNHWRSFENAISKAIVSCEKSGNEPNYHFACARKMIILGKKGEREVVDYHFAGAGKGLIGGNGTKKEGNNNE